MGSRLSDYFAFFTNLPTFSTRFSAHVEKTIKRSIILGEEGSRCGQRLAIFVFSNRQYAVHYSSLLLLLLLLELFYSSSLVQVILFLCQFQLDCALCPSFVRTMLNAEHALTFLSVQLVPKTLSLHC